MIYNQEERTWYGHSDEEKPMNANIIDKCYLIDTGTVFIFYNGVWEPMV